MKSTAELRKELNNKISKIIITSPSRIEQVTQTILEAIKSYNSFKEPVCLDEIFHFVGSGSYKVAYNPLRDLIVKFTIPVNPTNIEEFILNCAETYHVKHYFVPTEFINLETHIELDELTKDDDSTFSGIEIQPKILLNDHIKNNIKQLTFEETKLINKKCAWSGLHNQDWINCCISFYGVESFLQFLNFCSKFKIYDLHNKNIGYYRGKPVVLDWLSEIVS